MTLPERLEKSLEQSGLSAQHMAEYLETDRATVAAWLAGEKTPSTITLRTWALATGVSYQRLRYGGTP